LKTEVGERKGRHKPVIQGRKPKRERDIYIYRRGRNHENLFNKSYRASTAPWYLNKQNILYPNCSKLYQINPHDLPTGQTTFKLVLHDAGVKRPAQEEPRVLHSERFKALW